MFSFGNFSVSWMPKIFSDLAIRRLTSEKNLTIHVESKVWFYCVIILYQFFVINYLDFNFS